MVQIGNSVTITVASVSILASDQGANVGANSNSTVPAQFKGANASNTTADIYSNDQVNIGTGANITGTNSVNIVSWANGAVTSSTAVCSTTGVTGSVNANAESTQTITANVYTAATSMISTHSLNVVANALQNDTFPDGYKRDAQAKANTVVNKVIPVVREVVTFVADVLSLWGLLFEPKRVVNYVTEYIVETLQAATSATQTGSQNNSDSVNVNSGILALGTCPAVLTVDGSGNVQQEEMVTATDGPGGAPVGVGGTFSSNNIYIQPIANTAIDSIVLNAVNGTTTGNSQIEFDCAIPAVTITNNSSKNMTINGVLVYNQANAPIVKNIGNQVKWAYTIIPSSKIATDVNISSTDAEGGDITIAGTIDNQDGTTEINSSGGNIISTGAGTDVDTRIATLTAPEGLVGSSSQPINILFPTDVSLLFNSLQPFGISQATGANGVYLTVGALSAGGSPTGLYIQNVSSTYGNVIISVLDTQIQYYKTNSFQTYSQPSDSTVDFGNVSAGENIIILSGVLSYIHTNVMLDGVLTAGGNVTISATGWILSCNPKQPEIVSSTEYLQSNLYIGSDVTPINSQTDLITASTLNGGIYLNNMGSATINGINAYGPFALVNTGTMSIDSDIQSTGAIYLHAIDTAEPGDDLTLMEGISITTTNGASRCFPAIASTCSQALYSPRLRAYLFSPISTA